MKSTMLIVEYRINTQIYSYIQHNPFIPTLLAGFVKVVLLDCKGLKDAYFALISSKICPNSCENYMRCLRIKTNLLNLHILNDRGS